MTAVPASIARAVLAAILLVAAATSVLWPVFGPQGFATLAWLAVTFVMMTGAVLGLAALQPKGGG